MKFSKLSQLFLVSSIGLIVATLLTACQLVTIDYVFVAASAGNTVGGGQIYTYAADSKSGALRPKRQLSHRAELARWLWPSPRTTRTST